MFKKIAERKERKTSRNFVAPTKDQATTGRFMPAGDDHGIGFRTPIGTEKPSGKSPIPMKSFCHSPEEI